MEAIEAILTRRSIRKYSSRPVSEDDINLLLEAAMSAPSAGNEQPWHFIVIRDRGVMLRIPEFHPYSGMLAEAAVAVLVCGDLSLERHKGLWVQDCSAAAQNILLAAHAIGLGAVWLGVHPRPERADPMKELLKIPDEIIPFALIAIGHPAEHKPRSDRFNTNRIHKEHW